MAQITCSQCNGWYDSERELREHIQGAHRRFFSEESVLQHDRKQLDDFEVTGDTLNEDRVLGDGYPR